MSRRARQLRNRVAEAEALADRSALGGAVQECDSADCRAPAEPFAPARRKPEMQLGETFLTRDESERNRASRDSVGAGADRNDEGARRAGRADEWLEGDQARSDPTERGAARDQGTRPLQRDPPAGLVGHDDRNCEACPRSEAEDRGGRYLHKCRTAAFGGPHERRLDQRGPDRSRGRIRRTRREDGCRGTSTGDHHDHDGKNDPVPAHIVPRSSGRRPEAGPWRHPLHRSNAVHLTVIRRRQRFRHASVRLRPRRSLGRDSARCRRPGSA